MGKTRNTGQDWLDWAEAKRDEAQVARSRGVSERTVQRWIYDAMAREAWGLI